MIDLTDLLRRSLQSKTAPAPAAPRKTTAAANDEEEPVPRATVKAAPRKRGG